MKSYNSILIWIGSVLVIIFCSFSFAIPEKFIAKLNDNLPGIDVEYHDTEEKIRETENIHLKPTVIRNHNGRPVAMYTDATKPFPVYYIPGSFVFSPSIYVPTYEDSILLQSAK